jgi:5-methylcytosine-specific restriction endonuclease McrA
MNKRPKGYSNSVLGKLWAKKTKEIANHKCEICGATEELESHHIQPCKIYSVRWDLQNCVVLCKTCHKAGDYSAHKNPAWFAVQLLKLKGEQYLLDLAERTVKNKNWRERLVEIKESLL